MATTSNRRTIPRRRFLVWAAGLASAAALSACAQPQAQPTSAPQPTAPSQPTTPPKQPTAGGVTIATPTAAPQATAAPKPTAAPTVAGKKFQGVTVKAALIGGANYEEMYKSIPKWEEQTGAKVEIVYKGDGFQIDKKLKQDFAAGTVDYDVAWDHTSFFSQYVKAGGIEPLDNLFTKEELTDFVPRILDFCRKDGRLWMIPRHFDVSCLHYRTDIPGVKAPETWDELKAIAIEVSQPPSLYGTQFAGKEEALTGRFYEVLLSEGGQLFDKNWKPVFNSKAGVKAATFFRDLYQNKAMPPGMTNFVWEDVAKNFANGQIALYTEWYGWYSFFQDPNSSKVAGKFDLARQPKGDGGVHGGWAGAHAFSVTKASKNKEAAADLIRFLTSVDVMYDEAKLGFSPVRASVWQRIIKDAEQSKNPLDKKRLELNLLQAEQDFVTPPQIAEWLPFSDLFYPILQAIILGDKQPQAGLDEAVQKTDELMRKAGYYQ